MESARRIYCELFGLISDEFPGSPARIHAQVAQVLALAFCARQQAGASDP